MKVETIPGPAFAAPYLVNDDATSGYDAQTIVALEAWKEFHGVVSVLSTEGEEYFSRHWALHVPSWRDIEPNATAGTLIDYVCEVQP